jgi:hypothetical protein
MFRLSPPTDRKQFGEFSDQRSPQRMLQPSAEDIAALLYNALRNDEALSVLVRSPTTSCFGPRRCEEVIRAALRRHEPALQRQHSAFLELELSELLQQRNSAGEEYDRIAAENQRLRTAVVHAETHISSLKAKVSNLHGEVARLRQTLARENGQRVQMEADLAVLSSSVRMDDREPWQRRSLQVVPQPLPACSVGASRAQIQQLEAEEAAHRFLIYAQAGVSPDGASASTVRLLSRQLHMLFWELDSKWLAGSAKESTAIQETPRKPPGIPLTSQQLGSSMLREWMRRPRSP